MSINISKSPCYQCESRQAGCHAECEAGKEYTAALSTRNQEIKDERDKEAKFNAYKADRIFDTKRSMPNSNLRQKK